MNKINLSLGLILILLTAWSSPNPSLADTPDECRLQGCSAAGCFGTMEYCLYLLCPEDEGGPTWCKEGWPF